MTLGRTVVLVVGLVGIAALGGCSGDEPAATVDSAAAISSVDTAAAAASSTVAETAPSTTAASTTVVESTTTVAPTTAAPTTAAPTTVASCRDVPAIPLGLDATTPATLAVRLGDCGPGVTQIQELLRYRGYDVAADGRFGPATDAAVRDFQSTFMRTRADGIVGPMTWEALNSDDLGPGEG